MLQWEHNDIIYLILKTIKTSCEEGINGLILQRQKLIFNVVKSKGCNT